MRSGLWKKAHWYLLGAYVLALNALEVLDLPWVGSKVQVPELVFLLLLVGVVVWGEWRRVEEGVRGGNWKTPLVGWLGAVFLSAAVAGTLKGWLEFVGVVYLGCVFLLFKSALERGGPEGRVWLVRVFGWAGLLGAGLGLTGWVLSMAGWDTPLAWSAQTWFPYLGHVARAQGLTGNPNMLHSLLAGPFLLLLARRWSGNGARWEGAALGLIGLGLLLCLSRATVLLLAVVFWLGMHLRGWNRGLVRLSIGGLVLVFLFFSHVLVGKRGQLNWAELRANAYTLDRPFLTRGDWQFVATNYLVNKRSALLAGWRHFPFGVGPGGHNAFVQKLKAEGLYPGYFTAYDPHCTYTGTWGELGLLGLLALGWLGWALWRKSRSLLRRKDAPEGWLALGLTACLLLAALEALTTDIMNFRHYWVLAALLAALPSQSSR